MSAAVAYAAEHVAATPRATRRRHLHSVDSGRVDQAPTPGKALAGVDGLEDLFAGVEPINEAAGCTGPTAVAPLRITRRGRLAVTGTVAVAVVLLAAALLGVFPAGASPAVSYTVRPGDTLSEIAATHLPGVSLDRAIVQIQHANRLSTAQVQAGDRLLIPGR